MKTRTGFVSNSSTSSFVIVGVKVPRKKLFTKLMEDDENLDDDEPIDEFDGDSDLSGLAVVQDYEGEVAYIGEGDQSWDSGCRFIKMDNKIKKKVEKILKPLGLWNEKKFGIYSGTIAS